MGARVLYGQAMPPSIVFDVNETLLDLEPFRAWFSERFKNRPDAATWFSELLRISFVSSVTDRYVPFPALAASALETVAARSGVLVTASDTALAANIFTTLPAHPEVADALGHLRSAGYTVAALTNSPLPVAEEQLANAGIGGLFDEIMSVDTVHRFKPHRSVYQAAARLLGVPESELVMVAAHDWDVAGAMTAGCHGVFIARSGQVYSTSFEPPNMTAPDVGEAARMIVRRYG